MAVSIYGATPYRWRISRARRARSARRTRTRARACRVRVEKTNVRAAPRMALRTWREAWRTTRACCTAHAQQAKTKTGRKRKAKRHLRGLSSSPLPRFCLCALHAPPPPQLDQCNLHSCISCYSGWTISSHYITIWSSPYLWSGSVLCILTSAFSAVRWLVLTVMRTTVGSWCVWCGCGGG